MFELNNEQRACFGLDPVQKSWERVEFAGDKFGPASVLYFEGDVIKSTWSPRTSTTGKTATTRRLRGARCCYLKPQKAKRRS
ncbi:hypothetical protein [uncultured Campylobacter sp.]|uniref:hypothetical protein n=1 Tax=uncultured Campylobacter sp. TaxID=218934 RepID=UPI0026116639|nr:hypothetical protein [uncultured Campylobacter sp.]